MSHPDLTGVSCASSAQCIAVDSEGTEYTSFEPSGGPRSWSPAAIDPGETLTGVSCPDTSVCVAVDGAGDVLVKAFPGGWSAYQLAEAPALRSVSCATSSQCVAIDADGTAFASTDPEGGPGTWRERTVGTALSPVALSCYGPGECVAVDGAGDALASADPWAPAATWSSTPLGSVSSPVSLSCAASGLCVAALESGAALASDDPAAAVPTWSESTTAGAHLQAISCLPSGFCIAADTLGGVLTGRVPPPSAITSAASEVTLSAATLAGFVDPNDAMLANCHFDYGPTSAYGSTVPCAQLPNAASSFEPVSAQITGLAPNTVYHYRVLAGSGVGEGNGADMTFTTPVLAQAALVHPHPSIHGTPAVSQRLTCAAGTTGTASLSYEWLRDLIPIPSATASTYVVRFADSGHHLQCQVTAADAGGTATATSPSVTIPVGGIPASAGETAVGRAQYAGEAVTVPVTCSALAVQGCNLLLRLTVRETLSGRRVVAVTAAVRHSTVTLASARAFLAKGSHRTITLALTASARRLLASRHRLSARLTATGTVIGVIEAGISQQLVELGASSGSASRRRAGGTSSHGRSGHAPTPRG